jgi:hypothetical protein
MTDDEVIRAGTRRIVGRATLRRIGQIVREWQEEEREKRALAHRIVIVLALLSLALIAAFYYRYL